MKTTALLPLVLCLALAGRAQTATPAPSSGAITAAAEVRTPETLDTLLGPIALYPDPLVALILPASTTPADVVLAARYVQAGGDPAATDAQPWNESVKALAHYPDVLKWMNDNLDWTQALGEAFTDQPADVMNSVQRLRARARASGALVDTPQQHVVDQNGQIMIEPAQPDIVYVPVYDPAVVYVRQTYWTGGPFLTFGIGYPVGSWFIYGCDWGSRAIRVVSRPPTWKNPPQYWHHAAHRPLPPVGQLWHPPVSRHPAHPHPVYAHPPVPTRIVVPRQTPSPAVRPHTVPAAPRVVSPAPQIPRVQHPVRNIPPSATRPPRLQSPAAPGRGHQQITRPQAPRTTPPPASSSSSGNTPQNRWPDHHQ